METISRQDFDERDPHVVNSYLRRAIGASRQKQTNTLDICGQRPTLQDHPDLA